MARRPGPGGPQGGGRNMGPAPKVKTVQYRKWTGINITDARVAIEDGEFSWIENAMTIGSGAIQVLRSPGPAIATIAAGIDTEWGFTLNSSPVLMTVNSDGSMSQIAAPSGFNVDSFRNHDVQVGRDAEHPGMRGVIRPENQGIALLLQMNAGFFVCRICIFAAERAH